MHYHKLYRVARKAAAAARARSEDEPAAKRAVVEALTHAEPSLDKAKAEELAGAALLEKAPGPSPRKPTARGFWPTFAISLILAVLAAFAGLIYLFLLGLTHGPKGVLRSEVGFLFSTLPVSLLVWPLAAWWFGALEQRVTERILCALPVVHFLALVATLALG